MVPEPLQDLVRSRQSFYRRWAFHGDRVYQSLITDLIAHLGVTHFVETGTYLGDTSRFVAESFPALPILTCEMDAQVYARARRRLRRYAQIEIVKASSADVVQDFIDRRSKFERPLFFLDAHWYEYWPLADELKAISSAGGQAVIIVDDFEVPGHPDFAFDSYVPRHIGADAEAVVCSVGYLESALRRPNDYRLLLPSYSYEDAFPSRTDGALAGHAVVLQNLATELDDFLSRSPGVAARYTVGTLDARDD